MAAAPPWPADLALLLLRLSVGGLMFVNHGWGKVERLLGDDPIRFADPLGIGIVPSLGLAAGAETLGAALVALGLFTRLAAVPLAFTMAVAAFVVHAADPLADKEMALLYLAATLAIALLGPGRFAVGRALGLHKLKSRVLATILS